MKKPVLLTSLLYTRGERELALFVMMERFSGVAHEASLSLAFSCLSVAQRHLEIKVKFAPATPACGEDAMPAY